MAEIAAVDETDFVAEASEMALVFELQAVVEIVLVAG